MFASLFRGIFVVLSVVLYPVLFFTVVRAVVYYCYFSPLLLVATPPPSVKKMIDSQGGTDKTHTSKILLTDGAFGLSWFLFSLLLFSENSRENANKCYCIGFFVGAFVYVVLYVVLWCGVLFCVFCL